MPLFVKLQPMLDQTRTKHMNSKHIITILIGLLASSFASPAQNNAAEPAPGASAAATPNATPPPAEATAPGVTTPAGAAAAPPWLAARRTP